LWAIVRPCGWFRFARRFPSGWVNAEESAARYVEIDLPDRGPSIDPVAS
jgi:hypothetical protein